MRWKIMVNEKLPVHEEEGYIVNAPDENEEASVVPQPIADS